MKHEKILELLERDCTLSADQIAVMLDMPKEEVDSAIAGYKEDKTILGYKTLINWEKTDKESVDALIELKVTPQHGEGFDRIAQRIYNYPEVKSVYLMSGGFDITVIVEGASMKEVALFVANRLAPMDAVISTATHFVLKKYKQDGVIFEQESTDERRMITLCALRCKR